MKQQWHGPPVVLVVDDDSAQRALIAGALARIGVRAVEAGDGLELLAAFRADAAWKNGGTPDLVVTDVEMAPCSGLRALRALREAGIDTPVVLVTSAADDDVRLEAARCGALALLDKPVALSELRALVSRALQRGDAQRGDDARELSAERPALS